MVDFAGVSGKFSSDDGNMSGASLAERSDLSDGEVDPVA